jgi:hypothetical protein
MRRIRDRFGVYDGRIDDEGGHTGPRLITCVTSSRST